MKLLLHRSWEVSLRMRTKAIINVTVVTHNKLEYIFCNKSIPSVNLHKILRAVFN